MAKRSSHIFTALVADIILVIAFAAVGFYTHAQVLTVDGVVQTSWPFLVGLGCAWILSAAWTAPLAPMRTGVAIWSTTILLGMIIRFAVGAGIAGPFIIVASALNFLTLVGWRVIARAVGGRSAKR
ncbi:hypothetical protein HMPREF3172_07255 [Brevibacterium sp. HMSC08F02]|uniref:DUF3054 domain-containing protein n=1 Tax=Brevibacterium ravenspurgense TaxID=479117 RepID=A0A2I1IJV6_9MICO|nr:MULTISPECIES: DUF3054 domain-containing protein [Brevibacterium]OFT25467.1 hypothetical protein HMPREF3172_07255 [Brevibacterium sp. HMSC08F02]OFT95045.1 hypothetical protein HMPREF3092_00305 [Brevibacterium sp. HMSC24B04]PKY71372.1 DUF3054 domain-containing protein [Brevibacterium ravenspurgense]